MAKALKNAETMSEAAANQAESYELNKRSISAKFAEIRRGKWRSRPVSVPKVTILGR